MSSLHSSPREALRFPSGTATANVIRTLFGIPPDAAAAEVAAVERRPGDPAAAAAGVGADAYPRRASAQCDSWGRGRGGGVAGGAAPGDDTGSPLLEVALSRRRSNVADTPYLSLRCAQSLARADTSMTLGDSYPTAKGAEPGEWPAG